MTILGIEDDNLNRGLKANARKDAGEDAVIEIIILAKFEVDKWMSLQQIKVGQDESCLTVSPEVCTRRC